MTLTDDHLECSRPMVVLASMNIVVLTMAAGLLAGGFLTLVALAWRRGRDRRWAETEAQDLIDSARKDAEAQQEELNLQLEELKDEAWTKFENETRRLVQKNDQHL